MGIEWHCRVMWLLLCSLSLLTSNVFGFRLCQKRFKAPKKNGRIEFGMVVPNVDESLPWNSTMNSTLHTGYGVFSPSDVQTRVYMIGGTEDGSASSSFDKIQLFNYESRKFEVEIDGLLDNTENIVDPPEMNPSSVLKVWNDLYLMMPKVTSQYYWFWNSTSNNYYTKNNFPLTGKKRYCVMYDTTMKTALLSGGYAESDDNRNGLDSWHTMDLSRLIDSSYQGSLDWDSVYWTTNYSGPVRRFGHSCVVLYNIGMVFGGYTSAGDKKPGRDVKGYHFKEKRWESMDEKQRKKNKSQYKYNFWRTNGFCVSDLMNFANSSAENTKAYCFGGKTNNSHTNQAVTRVKYIPEKHRVQLELARKGADIVFTLKKHHIRPAGAFYNKTFVVYGGEKKKGGTSNRITVVKTDCGDKLHIVRNPVKNGFCVPYYVLYPLGCISSWFIGCMILQMFSSLSIDIYKRNDNKIKDILQDQIGAAALKSETARFGKFGDELAFESMYKDAIVESLTSRRTSPLPYEIAELIYQHFGTASYRNVLSQEYNRRRGYFMFLRCMIYGYEFIKMASLMMSFVILLWYYGKFVEKYQSEWQQASGLWLAFMYHPSVKFGAEFGFSLIYDWIYWAPSEGQWSFNSELYRYLLITRGILTLLLFSWLACVSVTSFWGGIFVFITHSIAMGIFAVCWAAAIATAEDDSSSYKWFGVSESQRSETFSFYWTHTLAASIMWSATLIFALVIMVTFAVFCTRWGWVKSSHYGFVGDWTCDYIDIDFTDWKNCLLLLSWLL